MTDRVLQGIGALPNKAKIGGVTFFVTNGIANSEIPGRAGDVCIDYAAGKMYIASAATATTDWALVTSA